MPLRSWYDYNPDPLGSARPTTTRFRRPSARSQYLTRNIHGLFPTREAAMRTESYEQPYTSPWEVLENLREQFEARPVSYTTDPTTGKVVASKSMPKPELPRELATWRRFHPWFGEGELTNKWVLPKTALTGAPFIQRQPPASDVQRQMGYGQGINIQAPNLARVSPETFWPSSAFKIPMREPAWQSKYRGMHTKPEPVFGATVDYTTGRWNAPPVRFGYSDPFGTFDPSRKTPPTLGAYRKATPRFRSKKGTTDWQKYQAWQRFEKMSQRPLNI